MKLRKMFALSRAVGRNELEKVEALCSDALAADERDLMALMALADAYWRNQRREDALTFALKALEVEPDQFYALRIVAGVYAERGEHEPAYRYARRLLDAGKPHLTRARNVSRILAALAWLPVVRRLKELVRRDERETESSYSKGLQWANGYVRWYESHSQPAP
jgi:tetratricopeptide (TPR) repeat protein